MRIAFLSGADKNAGDYLIAHRSKLLLKGLLKDCEIVEFARNKPLDERLSEINSCDVVVFAGGPGYVSNMYPEKFPLVDGLSSIHSRLFALGMGSRSSMQNAEKTAFTPRARELLNRFEADGFGLGCRDMLTKRILENNRFESAVFTGCPAWYDLSKVHIPELLTKPSKNEVRRIAVSDPAVLRNIPAATHLLSNLKEAFPCAETILVMHRGWTEDEFTSHELANAQIELVKWARREGIEAIDISYSHAGFSIYDDCDLHIGYRVHAHLYNISQRKPSYLIEEDSRGYGANEALGCTSHIGLEEPGIAESLVSKVIRKSAFSAFGEKNRRESARKMTQHVLGDIECDYLEAGNECKCASESFSRIEEHVLRLKEVSTISCNKESR